MMAKPNLPQPDFETGFEESIVDKVTRLMELLELIRLHPFLGPRVVLKGGTALNLFALDVPRLSVDIDLNYIGSAELNTMLEERPGIEQAMREVCNRSGLRVRRAPRGHAGGKWVASYKSSSGKQDELGIDMNFMFRTPLWPPRLVDSWPVASRSATKVPVLDTHELAAGKLSALFSRNASRDVFDAHQLLQRGKLDRSRLRLGFVVYGGISRRDWREVDVHDVAMSAEEVRQKLLPLLGKDAGLVDADIHQWIRDTVDECRDLLSIVLPFEPHELEFLNRLYDHGEIEPHLLTEDADMQSIICSHPGLLWRVRNIKMR